MRILVDLQALQTEQSRHRGIGRYSLALFNAMARQPRGNEISALFNGAFAEALGEATTWISDSVPDDRIHVFDVPGHTSLVGAENGWRARQAEALLKLKVDTIAPDYVHVASLFEGFIDDAVATIASDGRWSATIYDLIPWIQRERYLDNADVRRSYMTRLGRARQAGLLFAISNSAREEAIGTLGIDPSRVVDIQGDVDSFFRKAPVAPEREGALRHQLGLDREFILYTAGIDHRKNIEGLIEAFAALPGHLRARHQLVIVCKAAPEEKALLVQVARRCGLHGSDLVCTGYVDDADLADLYRLCKLFVFPSLHEGFGMPILEAMRCGAAVIGSDCSSMPEILGIAEAQFDPHSIDAMTRALARPLEDPDFLRMLVGNAEDQQARFSWDESARRVFAAFAEDHERRGARRFVPSFAASAERPRLAFVAPFPPDQSGIANYSSELVPALARHYDITLVTDLAAISDPWLEGVHPTCSLHQFERDATTFDRVLYQLGNSAAFHAETLRLMRDCPGVVVLHDFFLSNLFDHVDLHGGQEGVLREELFRSHGYSPLLQLDAAQRGDTATLRQDVIREHPASRAAFEHSYGTIVHSRFALETAEELYGVEGNDVIRQIEHIRAIPERGSREVARASLGIAASDVVVCSFGLLGPTKLNLELLRAWCASPLLNRPGHRLVFLGPPSNGHYDTALHDIIAAADAQDRIELRGFVDDSVFQLFLEAADCAVQLRKDSRGETSGAVLHCLANGLPVIVNKHGTLAELPPDATLQIPDRFSDADLVGAIVLVLADGAATKARVEAGMAYIREQCDAQTVAHAYHDAIERFYVSNPNRRLDRYVADLVNRPDRRYDTMDVNRMAWIAAMHAPAPRLPYRLVDLGSSPPVGPDRESIALSIRAQVAQHSDGRRMEPVFWDGRSYRFARRWTTSILGIAPLMSEDDEVDVRRGDLLLVMPSVDAGDRPRERWLAEHRQRGVVVRAMSSTSDAPPIANTTAPDAFVASGDRRRFLAAGTHDLAAGRTILRVYGEFSVGGRSNAAISITGSNAARPCWSAPLRTGNDPVFVVTLDRPLIGAVVSIVLDGDADAAVGSYRLDAVGTAASLPIDAA